MVVKKMGLAAHKRCVFKVNQVVLIQITEKKEEEEEREKS